MQSVSYSLTILTVILNLAMIASCSQVQADQFACELPPVAAKLSQSDTGTASGELKVDGKKVSLAHAYAIATDPIWADDKALVNTKITYTVLLTEQAMPDNLLQKFWLTGEVPTKEILEGRLKGLLIVLDTEGYNATFLYPPPPGWSFSSYGRGIEPGKLKITANQIAGEIMGSAPLVQNFEYKFSFKSPIQQRSVSTKLFTGEAALDTAPAKVYLAYIDALQQRNLEQMRRYLKDENLQSLNKLITEMGEDKFFSEFQLYLDLVKKLNQSKTANLQELAALDAKISELTLSKTAKQQNISLSTFAALLSQLPIDRTTLKQYLHKVVVNGGQSKIALKVNPDEAKVSGTVSLSMSCENGVWKL